jgi:DNA-directed RNA polymerase specialized sigma24 family protein
LSKDHDHLLELIDLLHRGQREQAFQCLYNHNFKDAVRYANSRRFRFITSEQDRQSAVNFGLAMTLHKLEQGEVRSNVGAYLRGIIKNDLLINVTGWRRIIGLTVSNSERTIVADDYISPIERYDDFEKLAIFNAFQAFDSLNDECKQRIMMKLVWGYSHQDILEEIPTTGNEANSRRKLADCLKKIRKSQSD